MDQMYSTVEIMCLLEVFTIV